MIIYKSIQNQETTVFVDSFKEWQCSRIIKERVFCKRIHIITDDNVAELYLNSFKNTLNDSYTITYSIIPSGESSKNFTNYEQLMVDVESANLDRNDYILYIGGGVVSDIATFVSATYKRGIGLIAIPTTLLAMIDSSIGGKCGINSKFAKNAIGAFYQPSIIIVNILYLQTLPLIEYKQGLAEGIKYTFIDKRVQIKDISTNFVKMKTFILNCINAKIDIVTKDILDKDIRQVLNLGHTLGHAIEKGCNIKHGDAVAIGIDFALFLSHKLLATSKDYQKTYRKTLKKLGIAFKYDFEIEKIIKYIIFDKKVNNENVNFILINKEGFAIIKIVQLDCLENYLKEWRDAR